MSEKLYEKCPFLGLDLGFWVFQKIEMKDEDLKPFCGYGTEFDSSNTKCVPRTPIDCSSIELPCNSSTTSCIQEKTKACNSIAGCGLNGMTELCDTSIASNCYTNTEHDLSYQKSACDANPNCAWDATKTINKCYVPIPAIPILVKEKKGFKKGCDGDTIRAKDLCGDGTQYNDTFHQCLLSN